MILYAVIMFAVAVLFGIIAALIYKGKTNLIHEYHQTNVQNKATYGKAFGKAMAVFPVAMALSGAAALIGENAMGVAFGILTLGLTVGIIAILRVQKKHNGGVF